MAVRGRGDARRRWPLRGRFIPPASVAAIRQLCRYRRTLVEERTREGQRLRKVLEDGGIKLDSVASDVLGVSSPVDDQSADRW